MAHKSHTLVNDQRGSHTFAVNQCEYDEYKAAINGIIAERSLDFPYKVLSYSKSDILQMFDNLRKYKPCFVNKPFNIGMVDKKIPNFDTVYYSHYTGNGMLPRGITRNSHVVIKEGIPDIYDAFDIIADMFNEEPRIKTAGYGEKYSPYEYWVNEELRDRWIRYLYQQKVFKFDAHVLREALYECGIKEARQGKPSAYISLYSMFNGRILDMSSAYGDRMLSAIAMDREYFGIDPWKDLFKGYSNIIGMFNAHGFIDTLMSPSEEAIILEKKYEIVMMSPAPFNMEKYGNYSEDNKEGQSYNTWKTWDDWIINYMFATIENAYYSMSRRGCLMVTILDRLKSKSFMSRSYTTAGSDTASADIEIKYTELFLLYCEIVGFEYVGTIGNTGSSGKIVPWWMFEKPNVSTTPSQSSSSRLQSSSPRLQSSSPTIVTRGQQGCQQGCQGDVDTRGGKWVGKSQLERRQRMIESRSIDQSQDYLQRRQNALNNMRKYYPDIYRRVMPKICVFMNITEPLLKEMSGVNNDDYSCTFINYNTVYDNMILAEILRHDVMKRLINGISIALQNSKTKVQYHKLRTYISNYIMVQSSLCLLTIDPLFPHNGNEITQLCKDMNYRTGMSVEFYRELFTTCKITLYNRIYNGIENAMNGAIILLNTLYNRNYASRCSVNMSENADETVYIFDIDYYNGKHDIVSTSIATSQLDFIRCKYCSNMQSQTPNSAIDFDDAASCMLLRYQTLGETLHNYTRTQDRYNALKSIINCDFEPFASPFNTYSTYYCSLFYDVDRYFGSLGNFFSGELYRGVYSVNPANDAMLVEMTINKLITSLKNAKDKNANLTVLLGVVTYNDEKYEETKFDRRNGDIVSWYLENGNVEYIKDAMSLPYCQGAYIINNEKYQTLDPLTNKRMTSPLTSITIVLSTVVVDMSMFEIMR